MKKIAFFIQHFICGGVERSLINLLDRLIDDPNNEIVVFAIEKDGDFINKFPSAVKLEEINIPTNVRKCLPIGGAKLAIRKKMKQRKYYQALVIFKRYIFNKKNFSELNIDFDKIPKIETEFDLAINYHMHSPFLVKFLSEKVNAKQKFTWIHNDFSTTGYNISKLAGYLKCNNGFFAVSNQLKQEYIEIFPEYKDSTELALNILNKNKILEEGDKFYPEEFSQCPEDYLKLLTVGRLEYQKGYDLAIEVCNLLKKEGLKFKWFVLGDGTEKNSTKKLIAKYRLEDDFILLGTRINPYPYFKNCDVYIQTSRHEGYCITISEAKIYYKPIVCTDVAGATEQFNDGIDASITKISVSEIFIAVKDIISNIVTRKNYSYRLSLRDDKEINSYLNIFK